MTLPPERLGDKGQRYEVRASGWPRDGESVVGWSADIGGAERMAAAARMAPSCTGTVVLDRRQNTQVRVAKR